MNEKNKGLLEDCAATRKAGLKIVKKMSRF